ncbi:hypothetical protein CDEF62S_05378 [Castellaniella defragrans]
MPAERGSVIVVIATDLPLSPLQLNKLARRATLGIGRGGAPGEKQLGDIFLAFSTANDGDLPQVSGPWRWMASLNDEFLDPMYVAVIDAVEEAVLNALLMAEDVPTARPAGAMCRALDGQRLMALIRAGSR